MRAACRGGAGAGHEQQELALVLVHVFDGGLGYGGDRAHDGDVQSRRERERGCRTAVLLTQTTEKNRSATEGKKVDGGDRFGR